MQRRRCPAAMKSENSWMAAENFWPTSGISTCFPNKYEEPPFLLLLIANCAVVMCHICSKLKVKIKPSELKLKLSMQHKYVNNA